MDTIISIPKSASEDSDLKTFVSSNYDTLLTEQESEEVRAAFMTLITAYMEKWKSLSTVQGDNNELAVRSLRLVLNIIVNQLDIYGLNAQQIAAVREKMGNGINALLQPAAPLGVAPRVWFILVIIGIILGFFITIISAEHVGVMTQAAVETVVEVGVPIAMGKTMEIVSKYFSPELQNIFINYASYQQKLKQLNETHRPMTSWAVEAQQQLENFLEIKELGNEIKKKLKDTDNTPYNLGNFVLTSLSPTLATEATIPLDNGTTISYYSFFEIFGKPISVENVTAQQKVGQLLAPLVAEGSQNMDRLNSTISEVAQGASNVLNHIYEEVLTADILHQTFSGKSLVGKALYALLILVASYLVKTYSQETKKTRDQLNQIQKLLERDKPHSPLQTKDDMIKEKQKIISKLSTELKQSRTNHVTVEMLHEWSKPNALQSSENISYEDVVLLALDVFIATLALINQTVNTTGLVNYLQQAQTQMKTYFNKWNATTNIKIPPAFLTLIKRQNTNMSLVLKSSTQFTAKDKQKLEQIQNWWENRVSSR